MKNTSHAFLFVLLFTFTCFHTYGQPVAPNGKKWIKVTALSDEFNGNSLDRSKWQPKHPYWSGRSPSQFSESNVSVSGGNLRLKSTLKNSNKQGNWVASACVTSNQKSMKPGYYSESRIKCSKLSMTTAFWFQEPTKSEIDVIENFGDPSTARWDKNKYYMATNTHYYANGWDNDINTPWEKTDLPISVGETYYTYGVWWKDARTIVFYLNGQEVHTSRTGGDFDLDMYMFFDTEVFSWGIGHPLLENLRDDTKNTGYVDWVHTYKLENGSAPLPPNPIPSPVKDKIAFKTIPKTLDPSNSYIFDIEYTATTTRDIVVEFWDNNWLAEKRVSVSPGSGNQTVTVKLPKSIPAGNKYTYKTDIRPTGTSWQSAIARAQVDNATLSAITTPAPTPTPPTNGSQLVANGTYYMVSTQSNQRLLAPSWDNHNARMINPGNFSDQRWVFNHLGNNVYTLKNQGTNRYLEVPYGRCGNGENVATWRGAGSNHQKWKIVSNGSGIYGLKPMHCQNTALDRAGGRINANATIWGYSNTNNNQKWKIITADGNKSIVNDAQNQITIHPNPVNDQLFINNLEAGDIIVIHDLMGKELLKEIAKQQGEIITMTSLSTGMYLISISGKTQIRFVKL